MAIGSNNITVTGLFIALGFILLGLFSTFPAVKALEKGRSFIKWYIFSLLLFPIALISSFAIKAIETKIRK